MIVAIVLMGVPIHTRVGGGPRTRTPAEGVEGGGKVLRWVAAGVAARCQRGTGCGDARGLGTTGRGGRRVDSP